MRRIFNTDALARILALQTIKYPLSFVTRPLTQDFLEFQTDRMREYKNPRTRVRYFNANVEDYMKPEADNFKYEPETPMTPDEIERETKRLNALPRDEQTVIYCLAMGFDVREFLREQGRYMYEATHGLLGLEAGL